MYWTVSSTGFPHLPATGYNHLFCTSATRLNPTVPHRTPEYRHVLRIPLEKVLPGSSPPKSDTAALQQRNGSHDAPDKVGDKTKRFFETSGHYKPSRKSAPPDSNGKQCCPPRDVKVSSGTRSTLS